MMTNITKSHLVKYSINRFWRAIYKFRGNTIYSDSYPLGRGNPIQF